MPFPFELSSPHIYLSLLTTIIDNKEDLIIHSSFAQSQEYIQIKLHYSFQIKHVDWKCRQKAFTLLPPILRLWTSKIFTNFSGREKRMLQQKRWESCRCKYCGLENEICTFHFFQHKSKILEEERDRLFADIFKTIMCWETEDEVKDVFY